MASNEDGLEAVAVNLDQDAFSNNNESKKKKGKSSILEKIETFKVRENSSQECQNVLKRETDFVREIRLDQTKRVKELSQKP